MTIVGYSYQADQYCTDCITDKVVDHTNLLPSFIGQRLTPEQQTEIELDILAAALKIDRQDERTFDSGDFPKVIFSYQVEGVEHCGNPDCEETL